MKSRFTVKKIISGSKVSYLVSGSMPGKGQIRKRFADIEAARGHAHALNLDAASTGTATARITRLTEDQIEMAERAFAAIKEGGTLIDAVEFYNVHHVITERSATVAEAVKEFIELKKRENLRYDTLRNLNTRLGILSAALGDSIVADVTPDQIRNLIQGRKVSPTTQSNDRRVMNNFFAWTIEAGLAKRNPAAGGWKIKVDAPDPEILTVAQVKALLAAAMEYKGGCLLGFVAVSLFAGLRPSEAERMEWRNVDLKSGLITITDRAAKLRQRRLVEIPDNLREWIMLCDRTGTLGTGNFRRDFAGVRKLAGWRPERAQGDDMKLPQWPKDVMRHTAISMRLATVRNEGDVALWAGNSPTMIHRNYKGLVDSDTAGAFWAITPDTLAQNNVVEMEVAK